MADETADRYTRRALSLLRAVNGLEQENARALRALALELRTILSGVVVAGLGRRDLAALVARVRGAVLYAYDGIADAHAAFLPDLANIEAHWAAGAGPAPRVASERAIAQAARDLLVQGAPLPELWQRQGEDLAFRAASTLRTLAHDAGAGPTAAMQAVAGNTRTLRGGLIERAREDAAALTDTAAHTAAYAGRIATFRAQGIDALEWFSILDKRTTIGCAVRAGKFYTLEFEPIGHAVPIERPPPRHFRCRSILLPHKLGGKPPPDVERDSFEQFLRRQTPEQQDEILGPRRAALWRAGKIKLADLIGQRGETLTLAELKARKD